MKIAVIGVGNVGGVIAPRWAQAGHEISLGVRDPQADKVRAVIEACGGRAQATSVGEAAAGAEVVVLATPFPATRDAVAACGDLAGKTVIDCTNPLTADLRGLSVGFDDSGAEQVAAWAAGASVVKALSITGAGNMADPAYADGAASMFICGDDDAAKAVAGELCGAFGFDIVDCGPLSSARLLEPLALLWISLAYKWGNGADIAFRLMRR